MTPSNASRKRCLPLRTPRPKTRTALLRKLKPIFRRHRSGPLKGFIEGINPTWRRWVPYVAFGHASRRFLYIRGWVEQQVRRHLATARKRSGFDWKRWSRRWLSDTMGLFDSRVMDSAIERAGLETLHLPCARQFSTLSGASTTWIRPCTGCLTWR